MALASAHGGARETDRRTAAETLIGGRTARACRPVGTEVRARQGLCAEERLAEDPDRLQAAGHRALQVAQRTKADLSRQPQGQVPLGGSHPPPGSHRHPMELREKYERV